MISLKPLDQIVKQDIDSLVADRTSERRAIEYKLTLPSTTDSEEKEFVADVSSLANSQGGDLVFGIEADDGVPTAAPGLTNFNEDATRLRFESLMRDGLDPRLHGVEMQAISGFPNGSVFVLRIQRSWSGPHRVKLNGASRFYLRGSAGKFEMDTTDMRTAFEAAGDVPRRLRAWRSDRLEKIVGGNTPVRTRNGPTLVLHIAPFSSLAFPYQCTAGDMQSLASELRPMGVSSSNSRINVDGLLQYAPDSREPSLARASTQVYRSGAVEAVKAGLYKTVHAGHSVLAPDLEAIIIESVQRYLKGLYTLHVPLPAMLFLTFVNAQGACVADGNFDFPDTPTVIDRNVLEPPEVLIDSYNLDVPQVLRHTFDGLWNACGFERSLNYDAYGQWSPRVGMF